MRTFTLPQGVDENQIRADFENGVLTVHIPKTALPQPKRIEIAGTSERQQAAVGSGAANQQSNQQSNANQQVNAGQSNAGQQTTGRGSSQRSSGTAQRDREADRAAQNR
jgi:hypothetical protein